jgi:uncharacterized membrane protein YesL
MAGFFGLFDYTKEGPGIPKDAPPKSRFVIFFEVLGRKFWKIVRVNLMYGLFNLPSLLFVYLFGVYYLYLPENFNKISSIINMVKAEQNIEIDPAMFLYTIVIPILLVVVCLPLITVGPAHAGMTYILRNFSREEHAFIWSDFIEHTKKNFKQGMIVGAINIFVTIVVFMDLYILPQTSLSPLLKTGINTFIIVAYVIFMMMSMYIYPMMVTFKLTIRQLYRNAFFFAIMKLIPNLLILILCVALVFLPLFFYPAVGYIVFIIITMALISYITNFYVYAKIDKYMIQPSMQSGEEEKAAVQE